jgi:hypothetical protein
MGGGIEVRAYPLAFCLLAEGRKGTTKDVAEGAMTDHVGVGRQADESEVGGVEVVQAVGQ